LIICTTIIGRQLNFLLQSELGMDKANVFVVPMNNMSPHYQTVKAELLANPAIASVSCGNGNIATLDVSWDGKNPNTTFFVHDMIWAGYNPGAPFDYAFIDDIYQKHYISDQRTSRLFTLFTGIAIVISCLGLLGLITYTAQLRVKEIGIRKVLGATAGSIVILLARNFLMLIAISMLIALPAAWYAMDDWLGRFAYRTTVPWWVYGVSCVAAVAIALITIGVQSVKAAVDNPVKSLRE
jgi:putative ABC transport system permease protein